MLVGKAQSHHFDLNCGSGAWGALGCLLQEEVDGMGAWVPRAHRQQFFGALHRVGGRSALPAPLSAHTPWEPAASACWALENGAPKYHLALMEVCVPGQVLPHHPAKAQFVPSPHQIPG